MEIKKENTKNLNFNIWGELYATKEGKKQHSNYICYWMESNL